MTILKKDSIVSFFVFVGIIYFASSVSAQPTDPQNIDQAQPNYLADFTNNPTLLLVEKYIRDFHTFMIPVFGTLEKLSEPAYQELKKNIWLNLVFSAGVALIGLRVILSFLRSFCKSKKNYSYNREEPISLNDVKEHFKKFSGELDKMRKQIADLSKSGIKVNSSSNETTVINSSGSDSTQLKAEINDITQNLAKNEETINKFLKEKKHVDNFLLEFQKEVVESHKTIWKELYTLRNILTLGKSATPTSSTPLNKPRTHDRTMSTIQASLDMDKNSPNISSKSIDSFSKGDFIREFDSGQGHKSSLSMSDKNTIQAANSDDSGSRNKRLDASNSRSSQFERQAEPRILEGKHEVEADSQDKNGGQQQNDKLADPEGTDTEIKREVSPFRQPPSNGMRPPIKNGIPGRNMPIPTVRKLGPTGGSNPFSRPTNTIPDPNSSQV